MREGGAVCAIKIVLITLMKKREFNYSRSDIVVLCCEWTRSATVSVQDTAQVF